MKAITTPLIISSISFKQDRSLGFRATTPELTEEEAVEFAKLQGKNIRAVFEPTDEPVVEQIVVDTDIQPKTQSQRIKAVLFLLWKQEGEQGRFEDYYHEKTEKIINHLKERLDE